jgi:hypothetical protein
MPPRMASPVMVVPDALQAPPGLSRIISKAGSRTRLRACGTGPQEAATAPPNTLDRIHRPAGAH